MVPKRIAVRPSGPTVFLDVDGCLTSFDDGSSFLCMDDSSYGLSEGRLALFLRLLRETGAHVVVTSNWRRFEDDGFWTYGPHRFYNHLPELRERLGDRYSGDIPPFRGLSKSEALEMWGIQTSVDFGSFPFVILDDDPSEGFGADPVFSKRYIQCDPRTGFSESDFERAASLLSETA